MKGGAGYGVIGEGAGSQTDKTPAAKSLYRSIYLDSDIGIAFNQSNPSTATG